METARRTVAAGGGLRGKELAHWYARLEALRDRDPSQVRPAPSHVTQFRKLFEERYR
jgi:hypothetical protein